MCSVSRSAVLVAAAAALVSSGTVPASAKCQRMGFTVNDYGKDGPTRDAKDLLDKYIAEWTKEKGITKYTVGKKDVTCELYLNLIVVDEHTCTARATVCWGDDAAPGAAAPRTAPKAAPAVKPPPPAPAKKPKGASATG
jgi:hypothetical protein